MLKILMMLLSPPLPWNLFPMTISYDADQQEQGLPHQAQVPIENEAKAIGRPYLFRRNTAPMYVGFATCHCARDTNAP